MQAFQVWFYLRQQPQKGKMGVTKLACIYVKAYISVPEYGMTNVSNLKGAFTPGSFPKMGKKGVTKGTFVLRKKYQC